MKFLLATATAGLMALSIGSVFSADLAPLNSDTEKDRIDWSQLEAKFGAFPKLPEGTKAGAVSKTLTNEYWRSLGEGYKSFGDRTGVPVVYQAAQSEGDQLGQLTIAEGLVTQGYNVLLVSPQTDSNLQPIMEQAKAANVPVVNVNDAVIPQAEHYVGNVQRDNGVRVAKWFIKNRPDGGKVAIVEGQAGVYAAVQRTDGFKTTITEAGKFDVVASVPGNRAGELTGTVDSFPVLTGEVALESALRLVAGQKLPRVVATPQALITKDNADRYSGAGDAVRKALLEDAAAGQ
ncbi:substrate-binding domain-containing protein [Mesorhizobium sp. M0700]|uniref:substrate-binding domain-containing protein n=1 Tax=Mesorhizobium sp. M0700 TaxID=2956988 RepID=UPI00333DF9DE